MLVHGFGVSGRYFLPLARLLARARPTFVPDLPGSGRSGRPPAALDVRGLADALDGWLEAAGVEQPLLVGNSMGCQVVVDLLARRPDRAAAAVLVGPTVDRHARSWTRQAARLAGDGRREPPSLVGIAATEYLLYGPLRLLRTASYALADRIEDDLPRVSAPTLVIRGERDPLAPRGWAEEVVRLMPDARLVELRGEPHACHYSAPGLVASVVRRFVQEVEDERGEGVGRLPHRHVSGARDDREPSVR